MSHRFSYQRSSAQSNVMPTVSTSAEPKVTSYKDLALAGLQCKRFPTHIDFQVITPATTRKQHLQLLILVRNCVSLPVVSDMKRPKPLFVSRFNPEVTTVDV